VVEGVHFDMDAVSARDLGHKALTVNVSDVAAMGGSPRYALVSLALSDRVEMPWVVELYGGLREAALGYGMSVVGGDLSRSERVVISVAVAGEVARGRAVTRLGAKPGDRIVVTGELGAAAGGLMVARSERREDVATDWGRALLAAHDRPVARGGEGQTLAGAGATAMIDLSDGMAKDLSRVCTESGVGAAVHLPSVPVAPALESLRAATGTDPLALALGGGEDYELLAALPADSVPVATEHLRQRFGTALTDIGEFRSGDRLVGVDEGGNEAPLAPSGWDHFAA